MTDLIGYRFALLAATDLSEFGRVADTATGVLQSQTDTSVSAVVLASIFGVIVGGFGVLVTYLVGRQAHQLQQQRDREEWFRSFRAMQADFWTPDKDVAAARRMIANQTEYAALRDVLLRRNVNYGVKNTIFESASKVDCRVDQKDYEVLDALDRLLAILVRMDDARQTGVTTAQQRTWHRMHCEYWLRLIGDGRRPEVLRYCEECWPDLAKSIKKLVDEAPAKPTQ